MSVRGCVGVRIGGDLVTLLPEHPVGVGQEDTPDLAVAVVRCAGCGGTTPAVAPVTYKFYDDDHYGRLELWYESRHAGACAACKALAAMVPASNRRSLSAFAPPAASS